MNKDKLIHDGWLKLYERKIGDQKYEIIKSLDAVAGIVTCGDEILLVKQFRPAIMKETLEIPAGCMDVDSESATLCLLRELKEETGFELQEEDVKHLFSLNPAVGYNSSNLHIFSASLKEKVTNKVDDLDVTEMVWIKLDDIPKLMASGEIIDSKTILSYYYMKSERQHSGCQCKGHCGNH